MCTTVVNILEITRKDVLHSNPSQELQFVVVIYNLRMNVSFVRRGAMKNVMKLSAVIREVK